MHVQRNKFRHLEDSEVSDQTDEEKKNDKDYHMVGYAEFIRRVQVLKVVKCSETDRTTDRSFKEGTLKEAQCRVFGLGWLKPAFLYPEVEHLSKAIEKRDKSEVDSTNPDE